MDLPQIPPLPPQNLRLGAVEASWEQIDPGVVLIRLEGGTVDDRLMVHSILRDELECHGIHHAQFEVCASMAREGSWDEIMKKAKRLIDSGNVTILRNHRNVVAAHVIGDHGEYTNEFSRDDPDSWTITGWQCGCPWAQYAWGRTRQWKKYEGRVCAHVLAAFWAARRVPLDEDHEGPVPSGQKAPVKPPVPDALAPDLAPGEAPPSLEPTPEGLPAAVPGGGMQPQPPAITDPTAPPGQGVIPEQPELAQMPPAPPPVPGTTPGGGVSPPGAVSVPGAQLPSPFNPVQFPGGTYSAQAAFENGMKVKLLSAQYGLAEGKSEEHGSGQYRDVPAGSLGEVLDQDATTNWVECIFPLDTSGPLEPYHVRLWTEAKDLMIVGYPPGSPFIQRAGPH